MSQTRIRLTRAELYEKVWATPMRTLAKEFGMSDVGLAKVCRRHDIPVPPSDIGGDKKQATKTAVLHSLPRRIHRSIWTSTSERDFVLNSKNWPARLRHRS